MNKLPMRIACGDDDDDDDEVHRVPAVYGCLRQESQL